jgi:hypothetical protein
MLERVLWPRGQRTVTARPVAPRLSTLAGKTIGQLWDDLFRGDEIFPMLEAALAQRSTSPWWWPAGTWRSRSWRTFPRGASRPAGSRV